MLLADSGRPAPFGLYFLLQTQSGLSLRGRPLQQQDNNPVNLSKKSQVIVGIQIAGSAYAAITLLTILPGFDDDAITWLFHIILIVVPVLGFVSGLLYWAGKTAGYLGSIIVHALQIPMIITHALSYKLALGIGVFLKVFGPTKLVEVQFGASAILATMPEQQTTGCRQSLCTFCPDVSRPR